MAGKTAEVRQGSGATVATGVSCGNDTADWSHTGPLAEGCDNRPPYFVLAYIQRVE